MHEILRKLSPESPSLVTGHAGVDEKELLLERILENPRIPSPPTLALQLFQKVGQQDCKIAEITELLALDPGLSAKVLKTLNSAVYGRSRPITSVRQAVTLLGTRPLRSLVLGLALPVMQNGLEADAGLRQYWRNSVAGAVMARELAARCRWPAPDDEMAACLLRDLGMILLRQYFREGYDRVWTDQRGVPVDVQCAWEESRLGVHHADVGAGLLERWQLPIEMVEPIRYHHHPEQTPDLIDHLVDRAFLLDFVTRLIDLEGRQVNHSNMKGILQTARLRYGLERAELDEFLGAVRPKIEEFSAILGVDIGIAPDLHDLLAVGCEELVRVSLESAVGADAEAGTRSGTLHQAPPVNGSIHALVANPTSVHSSSRILQYEVVEVIGRGAMGIVVKAFDPRLTRHVAIKLLAPELMSSDTARQRFTLEARCAAALRHEHVVAIHMVDEQEGVPFLVMEYVHGASLAELIDQGKTFSVGEVARIGRQTALGLAAAHDARLIHRDVKPDNILIEEGTMRVRVADFGLARAIDADFHISQPGLLVGTPNYMSPEQVDGKPLSAASDLFSLGSVLYTLCTGSLPFQSETLSGLLRAVAEKAPTPVRDLNPELPQEFADLIEKLHAKNPSDRPSSAAMVAECLQRWCY